MKGGWIDRVIPLIPFLWGCLHSYPAVSFFYGQVLVRVFLDVCYPGVSFNPKLGVALSSLAQFQTSLVVGGFFPMGDDHLIRRYWDVVRNFLAPLPNLHRHFPWLWSIGRHRQGTKVYRTFTSYSYHRWVNIYPTLTKVFPDDMKRGFFSFALVLRYPSDVVISPLNES